MEDDGIFYGHLVNFKVFCYIWWTFGIVRGNLVHFSPSWYFVPRKIWQPCCNLTTASTVVVFLSLFLLLLLTSVTFSAATEGRLFVEAKKVINRIL
jgi:hypothetical protein